MAFCTKCGHALRDADRFCANCGAAVPLAEPAMPQPSPASQQPVYPNGYVQQIPPTGPGFPQKRKNHLLPVFIVVGSVALAVLILVLVISFAGRNGKKDQPMVSSMPKNSLAAENSPTPKLSETVYANHLNGTVSFSIDYPESYTLSEPNANNVLIRNGDDFRVAAEYAFMSQSDSFIYSAADFAAQIDADPQVLFDYVGATPATLQHSDLTIGGADACCYTFDLEVEGGTYQCALYLIEGKGDFGCYTIQTACRMDCSNAALYIDQAAHMVESFRVTGSFENPDFAVYRYPELDGLTFAVRNEVAAEAEDHETYVYFYPVEGKSYSARLEVRASKWSSAEDVRTVLEELSMDGFSVANGGHSNGFPEPQTWPVGRYTFTQMSTEYIRNDERFTQQIIVFPHGGVYWYIRTKNLAEYADAVQMALSDIIFSLDFMTDAGTPSGNRATPAPTASPSPAPDPTAAPNPVDLNWAVTTIMGNIGSNANGYVDDPSSPNKISVTDLDGDGCYEVLALYQTKESDGSFMVRGELASVQPDGSFSGVAAFTVFKAVGGNDGSISLAKNDADTLCIHLYERVMNGTSSRDVYDKYYPLANNELSLNEKSCFETHAHSTFNSQMEIADEAYYVDSKAVPYADYFATAYNYIDTVTLKPYGDTLGNVMTFAEAQTYDFNGALLK